MDTVLTRPPTYLMLKPIAALPIEVLHSILWLQSRVSYLFGSIPGYFKVVLYHKLRPAKSSQGDISSLPNTSSLSNLAYLPTDILAEPYEGVRVNPPRLILVPMSRMNGWSLIYFVFPPPLSYGATGLQRPSSIPLW